MAAQIADRGNVELNDKVLSPAPASKLEAVRLEAAQEQKKRIEAAVARVTGGKKSKRKSTDARDEHRSKKSKTLVDVTPESDKKNSIARRLADRFSALPEPEKEENVATRSVPTQQFVTRAVESHPVSEKTTEAKQVEETKKVEEESAVVSPDEEQPEEESEKPVDWEGPTTNFHVKQLGLDSNVDIYKPVDQQQQDVRRVRERAMYLPSGSSIATLETASDSENDSDFAPNDVESDHSDDSDAESLPDVDESETRALAEETEEFERTLVAKAAGRSWTKRIFVYTPLALLALIVLVFVILFAIDWSQETFQFCAVDAESAAGSEELLSCASFVETQSLIKTSLREAAEKLLSYFE